MYKWNAIGNYHPHLVDCNQCLSSSQSRVRLYIAYSLPVSIGSTSRQRQLKTRKIAPHLRVIESSLQGEQPLMTRKWQTSPSICLVSIIKVVEAPYRRFTPRIPGTRFFSPLPTLKVYQTSACRYTCPALFWANHRRWLNLLYCTVSVAAHPLCSYLSKSSKLEVILNLTYGKLHTFSFAVNEKLTLTQDMLDHIFPHVSQNAILYLVLSWPWEFTVCIW